MAYPQLPITFSQTPITFSMAWIRWSGSVPIEHPIGRAVIGLDGLASS